MKVDQRQKARETPDWLDQLVDEIQARKEAGELPSLAFLLESLLNEIMRRERDRFLSLNQGEQANGFYQRNLHLTLGKLSLKVPRVRYGNAFRPAILPPPWKRADKDYEELLIAMLANGYSQAQMERALKSLDLPFSKDALEDAIALIEEKLEFYKTQPLKGDWFAIFIDAYWGKLRTEGGKLEDISLFVAVGVDLDGNKEILGFWVHRGREKKGLWVEVFQDLVNRGVHRVLVFVTDDFKGVHEVIEKLFPYADHQLCHLHLRRNLKRELSREAYREAGTLVAKLRRADDQEEGREL
ncbi:transposase, partial [Candidatus Bipolaricaulota bacterium]|nr:transposase [Candidatus Bipolaricaulota bacterium]